MNTIIKKEKLSSGPNKIASTALNSISDIRSFFLENDSPFYFIGATGFNLLGAGEWIKAFKFITLVDCFDGIHPDTFCPLEAQPHEVFQGIEDINNYLLRHPEVRAFIHEHQKGEKAGKAFFLMFDERTEHLTREMGMELCFPSVKLREFLDNKVNTNRIAEKAGVPCVPYVLSEVKDYDHLRTVAEALGEHLVIQTPFGDSGRTTFFISNEADYNKYAVEIEREKEVKIMKRINCYGSAIEGCVTKHGTAVGPLMTELVGFEELTPYKGGWCGNEISSDAFIPELRQKAAKYTRQFGEQLQKEGYKGYFELDFLIDRDDQSIYLGELNPRITGASLITNQATYESTDLPLFLLHVLEWMEQDYELDLTALNRRWADAENGSDLSQMVIKYTEDAFEFVTEAPRSGIWVMQENGEMAFSRATTHPRHIELEEEAFFLRIAQKGDYLYKGAQMGILFMRGRMMTADFELTERAKNWIKAVRSQYESTITSQPQQIEAGVSGKAGFKFA